MDVCDKDRIILANFHRYSTVREVVTDLTQVQDFFDDIAGFSNENIIIGGDLNLCLESIDSAQAPSTQVQWESRIGE